MGEKKIFISGPITGQKDYKDKFKLAEDYLKSRGHVVINPAYLPEGLDSPDDYMDICYAMIDKCDEVYMLQGWSESVGSRKERDYAASKGIVIRHQNIDEDYFKFAVEDYKFMMALNDAYNMDFGEFKETLIMASCTLIKILARTDDRNKLIDEIAGMQSALQIALNSLGADSEEVNTAFRENMIELYEALRG